MKSLVGSALIIAVCLLLKSCNSVEPPTNLSINLTLEDVSCTEAWITLSTNLRLPATIELKQNNQRIKNIILTKPDSLLYIDSLLPNTSYQYQASSIEYRVTSNQLQLTTLDTTSHNFTFQTWTFGEHSSSVLYDVAIINENSIYAVGEIYMNDTLGQPDPQPYAVAHWDGSEWKLMKVPYHDFNQTVKYPGPLFSVAYIDGNIYVVSYANLLKWTGSDWEEKAFFMEQIPFDGQVIKMWGFDENNIYCVGRNGAIYFYFGSDWQKIESRTELDIYDIWGDYNDITNEYEILAVAAKIGVNFEKNILRIDKTDGVTSLSTNGIPYSLHGIWFKKKNCFVAGSGMYKKYDINSSANWEAFHQGISNYYIETIRGNDLNDIIACGAFGELLHFNGISWKSYIDITFINGAIGGDIKGSIVCCYGLKDSQAIVIIGRK